LVGTNAVSNHSLLSLCLPKLIFYFRLYADSASFVQRKDDIQSLIEISKKENLKEEYKEEGNCMLSLQVQ
jgi:hypothetical protein